MIGRGPKCIGIRSKLFESFWEFDLFHPSLIFINIFLLRFQFNSSSVIEGEDTHQAPKAPHGPLAFPS